MPEPEAADGARIAPGSGLVEVIVVDVVSVEQRLLLLGSGSLLFYCTVLRTPVLRPPVFRRVLDVRDQLRQHPREGVDLVPAKLRARSEPGRMIRDHPL